MLKMMLSIMANGILSKAVNNRCLNSNKHSCVILTAIASSSKKRLTRLNTFSIQYTSGERAGIYLYSLASISSRALVVALLHCEGLLSITNNCLPFVLGPACANAKLKFLCMKSPKNSALIFS